MADKNDSLVWSKGYLFLLTLLWFAGGALIGAFWFNAPLAAKSFWALFLCLWVLLSPFLSMFVLCIVSLFLLEGGHAVLAENAAHMAYIVARTCILPPAMLNNLNLGVLANLAGVTVSLYSNGLITNGKFRQAANLLESRLKQLAAHPLCAANMPGLMADLGQVQFFMGDLPRAKRTLLEAQSTIKSLPRQSIFQMLDEDRVIRVMALLHSASRDFATGKTLYKQLVDKHQRALNDPTLAAYKMSFQPVLVSALVALAGQHIWSDELDQAENYLAQSRGVPRGGMQKLADSYYFINLAELRVRQGRVEQAEDALKQALDANASRRGDFLSLDLLVAEAHVEMAAGRLDQCGLVLEEAAKIASRYVDANHPIWCDQIELRIELCEKRGDDEGSQGWEQKLQDLTERAQAQLRTVTLS